MQKKLINVVPTDSVVGVLLNNKNYIVVKSNEHSFYEHYPTTWNVFGEYFVKDDLASISKKLHIVTTKSLEKLDQKELKLTVETLASSIGKNYKEDFKLSFTDIKNFINNMKDADPSVVKYLNTIIDTMIEVARNK